MPSRGMPAGNFTGNRPRGGGWKKRNRYWRNSCKSKPQYDSPSTWVQGAALNTVQSLPNSQQDQQCIPDYDPGPYGQYSNNDNSPGNIFNILKPSMGKDSHQQPPESYPLDDRSQQSHQFNQFNWNLPKDMVRLPYSTPANNRTSYQGQHREFNRYFSQRASTNTPVRPPPPPAPSSCSSLSTHERTDNTLANSSQKYPGFGPYHSSNVRNAFDCMVPPIRSRSPTSMNNSPQMFNGLGRASTLLAPRFIAQQTWTPVLLNQTSTTAPAGYQLPAQFPPAGVYPNILSGESHPKLFTTSESYPYPGHSTNGRLQQAIPSPFYQFTPLHMANSLPIQSHSNPSSNQISQPNSIGSTDLNFQPKMHTNSNNADPSAPVNLNAFSKTNVADLTSSSAFAVLNPASMDLVLSKIKPSNIEAALNWSVHTLPYLSAPYYFDKKTGISTWEKPLALIEFERDVVSAHQWINSTAAQDLQHGNMSLGQTVLQKPNSILYSDAPLGLPLPLLRGEHEFCQQNRAHLPGIQNEGDKKSNFLKEVNKSRHESSAESFLLTSVKAQGTHFGANQTIESKVEDYTASAHQEPASSHNPIDANSTEASKIENPLTNNQKPVSSTHVRGTSWYVIFTADRKMFYYNHSTNKSVWTRPIELKYRTDVELYAKCRSVSDFQQLPSGEEGTGNMKASSSLRPNHNSSDDASIQYDSISIPASGEATEKGNVDDTKRRDAAALISTSTVSLKGQTRKAGDSDVDFTVTKPRRKRVKISTVQSNNNLELPGKATAQAGNPVDLPISPPQATDNVAESDIFVIKENLRAARKVAAAKRIRTTPATKKPILSNEARHKKFVEMLTDIGVSGSSTWETVLPKIASDKRYSILGANARRNRFDAFVNQMRFQEYKQKRSKRKFLELLKSKHLSPSSNYEEFASRFGKEKRFRLLKEESDRKLVFEELLKELQEKETEENREQNKMKFVEFLKTLNIASSLKYKDFVLEFGGEEIAKIIPSESDRESIFVLYMADLARQEERKSDELSFLEFLKNINLSPSMTYEEFVLRYGEDKEFLINDNLDRKGVFLKYMEDLRRLNFFEMLEESVLESSSVWTVVKSKFKNDQRFYDVMGSKKREELFEDFIEKLKHKKYQECQLGLRRENESSQPQICLWKENDLENISDDDVEILEEEDMERSCCKTDEHDIHPRNGIIIPDILPLEEGELVPDSDDEESTRRKALESLSTFKQNLHVKGRSYWKNGPGCEEFLTYRNRPNTGLNSHRRRRNFRKKRWSNRNKFC